MGKRISKIKKEGKEAMQRCMCPNNNLFVATLIAFIVFLLVELTGRIYDLYRTVPVIDIPAHFFAGIALGIGIYWIVSLTAVKRKKMVTLTWGIIAALVWEVFETLQEFVIYNPPYLRDIFFWDGFWDVIFTFLGVLGGLLVIYQLKNKTKILDGVEF